MPEKRSVIKILWSIIVREFRQLVSRPIYIFCIVAAPLVSYLFLLSLMNEGLPEEIPTAVVDLDHSAASRNFIRQLDALSSTQVTELPNSFTEARKSLQKGQIYGFLVIPENFEAKAMAGRRPEISFYTNNAYYIPGSLLYKSFKTMSVLASGAIVQQTLLAHGKYNYEIMPKLQPVSTSVHALGNPWISYSVYLNNTFIPGMLQIMILMTTVFSIGAEIKHGTSREWLAKSRNSVIIAVTGKLLPQTILFFIMGAFLQSLLYGYYHFPLHGGIWTMLLAMLLLILASQSLGVIMISIAPSLRIGLSIAALFGIISISITGFSFPVPAMYPPFQALTNIFPLRHYFLIYADQALNGIPLYYSRMQYLYLFFFAIASLPLLKRLKKALENQVYVP